MKCIEKRLLKSLFLSLTITAAGSLFAEGAHTIAVLELKTKDLEREVMLQYVDALTGALFRVGGIDVVDRTHREEVLGEIEFSVSTAADDKAQIEAGRLLAATYIVTGSLGRYDERIVAILRLVETATGRLAGSVDEIYIGADRLLRGADSAAASLVRGLPRPAVSSIGTTAQASPEPDPFADMSPSEPPPMFPFQLSLWSPLQLVPPRTAIYGLRLGLAYADNIEVIGVDVSLVSRASSRMIGLQLGIYESAGQMTGLQIGVVGYAERLYILQMNVAYNGAESVVGAQLGLVNVAQKCIGTQIGVVNVAGILKGVQLGLVNVVRYGDWAGFMPIINIRF